MLMRFLTRLLPAAASLLASTAGAELLQPRDTVVAPYDFPSDQNWDGIDGNWSTFTLQVGTPAQTVRVLLSWTAYQTLVVDPEGCYGAANSGDCAESRGREFSNKSSSTWDYVGLYFINLGANFGYLSNGYFGYESVTLAGNGENGLTLKNSTVGATASPDLYLGFFGVNPKSTNFTSFNNPSPSYMSQLKSTKQINSLSFGYTGGARYRFSGTYASLTLGGYDTSKYIPNGVTFTFNADNDHQIIVALQQITTPSSVKSSPNAVLLLPNPIYIELDSVIPEIWLPLEACRAFEAEFGLIYNNTNGFYLVNDTQHSSLLARNANVTFTIGQLTSGGSTLQIVLPYAAFDLTIQAGQRGLTTTSKYFPLRRADNSTQYVLGRTFMQEAYLIVDYEVSRFQLAQALWDQTVQKNLVAIPTGDADTNSSSWTSSQYKPSYSLPTELGGGSDSSSSSRLSPGAIAGIVVGVVVLLALVLAAFFLIRRRRRHRAAAETAAAAAYPDEKKREDQEDKVYPKAELMGSTPDDNFGMTQYDLDRKAQQLGYPPSSSGGTPYSPTNSSLPYTPAGEGTMSSSHSNAAFPTVINEAHSRAIYEMPGDMPNREKDGRQLSEKEALQHRERIYNGIDEALENPSPNAASPTAVESREARRVAPENIVNVETGDPLGRHRAFSFDFDSEREALTSVSSGSGGSGGTDSTFVQPSPQETTPPRHGEFI